MLPDVVFEAVRRGYNELESASNQEILAYFDAVSPDAMIGHINNIKGIAFEQEVASRLAEYGLTVELFESTNHPVVDISILTDSDIAIEAQLKATDSASYINATLEATPETPIIATSEVAVALEQPMVINSGIGNEQLTHLVESTLFDEETLSHLSNSLGIDWGRAAEVGMTTGEWAGIAATAHETSAEMGTEVMIEGLAEAGAESSFSLFDILSAFFC